MKTAGTQAGEEIPVVSRTNIKEYKDSFSNEKFDFRNYQNITFFVYVSNFTWPIKIEVGDEKVCRKTTKNTTKLPIKNILTRRVVRHNSKACFRILF